MAKLADAADLKSAGPKGLWGFDSPSRHQLKSHWYAATRRRVAATIIIFTFMSRRFPNRVEKTEREEVIGEQEREPN